MKTNLLAVCVLAFSLSGLGAADESETLFNGKDLSGWEGKPQFWSVKDGAIVGRTTKETPTKGNTFLVWKGGEVDDFELHVTYRITAGNSGIQYRSKDLKNFVVGGYQGDFEFGTTYSGILYDESGGAGGRGIMAARGEKVVWGEDCKKQVVGKVGDSKEIQSKIKQGEWNDYVIIAKGKHLVHKINGITTVDVTDECAKGPASGIVALQLHAGEPMMVEFKSIRLKKLK